MSQNVLEVRDAVVQYKTPKGFLRAVDEVSLNVVKGQTVAVVGESGCGKTTLAKAVLGLEPIVQGEILLNGRVVKGVRRGLAADVGIVWQDPYASLHPKWSVRRSLEEPGRLVGQSYSIDELLDEVGLDRSHGDRYPHQLSGGQRQRVAIGRAVALRPSLIICDEPTAALDLSIQAQILNLLRKLQQELDCTFLYISHDLQTVRFLADHVAVMYRGKIVENRPTEDLFSAPNHLYTKGLLEAAPTLDTLGQLPTIQAIVDTDTVSSNV